MLSVLAFAVIGIRESKYRLAPFPDPDGNDEVIFMPRVVRSPNEGIENFSLDSYPASGEYPSTNVRSPFCSYPATSRPIDFMFARMFAGKSPVATNTHGIPFFKS